MLTVQSYHHDSILFCYSGAYSDITQKNSYFCIDEILIYLSVLFIFSLCWYIVIIKIFHVPINFIEFVNQIVSGFPPFS